MANIEGATLHNAPTHIKQAVLAIRSVNTVLHEHTHTVHGIKDLVLAQNWDVHVLAIKRLVHGEGINQDIFPEDVRTFARNYFKQKKGSLFLNSNGFLCVKYPASQRPLYERTCMIVMPQLYQHGILFRAHDDMGHQGISKVVARIQERHTWPGIRRTVGEYVSQCLTCQQVRDKPGDVRFHLKNIQSGYFNELVQYDHMKICPTDDDNTGILVIIDHFSKFAEAVPCSHDEYDGITTSRLLLQKWFARHGTPTRMQSDNAPNLTAEVSNEFMKASQVTKVTSTAGHPRTQGLVERQNRTLLTLLRVFCSRRMRDWDQHLDEVLGQNWDVHVLAIKRLVHGEGINQDIFPEDVRTFARNYFKQKKGLLFLNSNGVLCVKYPASQRPLYERPCMIVMPQLYQHEILFRAHDDMGHQGISKVVARQQERHTWPGIRRTVGEYVSQCLTCQQVRDKPGDVRFHLKNIQSGDFNELVQYDHMKICPTDGGKTGILVIIDHFSNFAEAVPCSHDEYDGITTSRLLLQKWFARHATPTRMQSDNAPNLTAEVSNEFMKVSQVPKVTSTAGHPRTQGLVERQNRTLLTLLRVFCSRRMRDWDQHLDEVLGAYNSTRHATTGFSPNMLTRGTEKAIPLTYLYPEFATQSFPTHDAYVDHVLARQQKIHDLVRRNTHQAQLRQKLKYDRAIRAKAYAKGDLVWVFCRYVPQKGSPKLMRAWRGPHRVVHTLQDGRVYILDTGQKFHFERLKPHNSGPLEFVATPLDTGDVAVVMDPEPEHS